MSWTCAASGARKQRIAEAACCSYSRSLLPFPAEAACTHLCFLSVQRLPYLQSAQGVTGLLSLASSTASCLTLQGITKVCSAADASKRKRRRLHTTSYCKIEGDQLSAPTSGRCLSQACSQSPEAFIQVWQQPWPAHAAQTSICSCSRCTGHTFHGTVWSSAVSEAT